MGYFEAPSLKDISLSVHSSEGLPDRLRDVRRTAGDVARSVLREQAEEIDREARWPAEAMRALGEAELLGLNVRSDVGGRGEGMLALAHVTEELGRECASTALVYGMHCVAAKVIDVKPTEDQAERILRPIAAGEHVTSLALAEPGTGVHFYLPRTTFRREGDEYVVNGHKSFVTSGGEADSYVLSVVAEGLEADPGTFSCLLLEADNTDLAWQAPWDGLGMRGNSSRGVELRDVRVPADNLLGAEGDETWFVFEVIAPYFIVAMAGTYLGIAAAALDEAVNHIRKRAYDHTGQRLADEDIISHRVGEIWSTVERTRLLLHHAAALGDAQDPNARAALFAAKAEVADAAVAVVNESMTLVGGRGYGRGGRLGRALRDVRASHIMSPTTDLLKTWLGRTVLDLPLL